MCLDPIGLHQCNRALSHHIVCVINHLCRAVAERRTEIANPDLISDITICHPFLPRCMECRRGLAMRILSVRLSVTRVDCDKTVERSVQIYISYERTFSLVF